MSLNARAVRHAVYWFFVAVAVVAFAAYGTLSTVVWAPLAPMAVPIGVALVLALAAGPWLKVRPATVVALLVILGLTYFWGVGALASILLLVAAAYALGSLLMPERMPGHVALSVTVGLVLVSTLLGWLLPFPVHTRLTYLALLVLPVVLRRRRLAAACAEAGRRWSGEVDVAPWAALATVLVVAFASTVAWLPTVGYDSLAYHTALPTQLMHQGYYQMAAATNIWALSPWASDVIQASVWMLAGGDARGLVDAMWMALALSLIWQMARHLQVPVARRWLACALYASTPIIASTLLGMETEGPTAALVAAAGLVVAVADREGLRGMLLTGVLMGGLMALKVSNVLFVGPLGLWFLWRWRGQLRWRRVAVTVAVALAIALPSYAYAYVLTGNPFLPLFNKWFGSPFFPPVNFHDTRWDHGSLLTALWGMVFDSRHYIEGGKGALSFYPVALLGGLLLALYDRRARPLALVGLLGFVLPVTQIHYLRYPAPALAWLIPAMLAGVPADDDGRMRAPARLAGAAAWLLVGVGMLFVPKITWILQHDGIGRLMTEGTGGVVSRFAAGREIEQFINARYGDDARAVIIDPADAFNGLLDGRGFVTNYYDPVLSEAAAKAAKLDTAAGWERVLRKAGASLAVTRNGSVSPALGEALVAQRGEPVRQFGDETLWELRPGVSQGPGVRGGAKFAAQLQPLPAGTATALLDARARFRCNPARARFGHIVVGWTVSRQHGPPLTRYAWRHCPATGVAAVSLHRRVANDVSAVSLDVQSDNGADMGLQLIRARAVLRNDLRRQRDLARTLWPARWKSSDVNGGRR